MTREEITVYTNRISNANPSQLVVIQYDMAMDYIKSAIKYHGENNIPEFTEEIKRAKRVINQLASVLDMKYNISMELLNIYLYLNNAMVRAFARKETQELERCLGIIEKLRTAFYDLSKQDERGPVMENVQQVYAGLTYSKGMLNETMQQDDNRGYIV